MNIILVLLLILGCQYSCLGQARSVENRKTWGRSIIGERIPDGKDKHLELVDITQEPVHLVGLVALTRDGDSTTAPLVIQGHLDKTRIFSANLALEVSNEETKDWKSVESSLSDKIEVTLTAAPDIRMICILVQFDAFQPFIDKYRFGRITLQTGESTVFSLLLLTEDRGESKR
jgi:hypothetical protein